MTEISTILSDPPARRISITDGTSVPSVMAQGCPSLTLALAKARDRCKAASKDARNEYQKFDYASADQVIKVASEAMADSGLALLPVSEELYVLGNAQMACYALRRELILSHSSGEFVPLTIKGWPVVPDRGRPLDKAYAIALTSSLAYKLRDLLQMPRGTSDDVAATPAPPQPQPQQVPDPNAQSSAAARPPTISEEQLASLSAIARAKGRTLQEVQSMTASAGVPVLAKLPATLYPWAALILTDGQVDTPQVDRIAATLQAKGAAFAKVAAWLQEKFGVPRLRLLTRPQADELERILATLKPAATPSAN